jgi:hypothetical protein
MKGIVRHIVHKMDPFSITVGCVGLTGGIANLSSHIAQFVSEVRSARKDMEAVSSALSSLLAI